MENSIVREGEMKISFTDVELRYREENAFVYMKLQGDCAEIERQGDYSLRLHLKQDEETKGSIGIGGTDGEIGTFAHRVAYSVSKDSVLLSLHYDLLISGDVQTMKLRLLARAKGEKS